MRPIHRLNEERFHRRQRRSNEYGIVLLLAALMWFAMFDLMLLNPPLLSCEAQNPGHVHKVGSR